MKKRPATPVIVLLATLLLTALLWAIGAPLPAAETKSEEQTYAAEKKVIPVEVPGFVDHIRVFGRIQPLWKIWGEHDSQRWGGVGLGDILEDEGFRILRWRFGISADLFEHVVLDVSMGESEFRNEHDVNLMDAKATLTYTDYANVIIGADKLPFGREHMTSSRNLQFIFRPVQVDEMVIPKLGADPKDFNPEDYNGIGIPDRDVGIGVAGKAWEGMLKYYAGIYNGTGQYFTGVVNYQDDDDFLQIMEDYCYVVRVVVNPLGDFPDVEADFGRQLRVSLGGSAFFNDITPAQDFDNRYQGWGVDGEIKGYGASFRGEWVQSKQKLSYLDNELETTWREGFYLQAGYFVLPNFLELAYRYEQFDDNSHFDDNGDIKYHTIGVNYYVMGDNNYKVQMNYIIRGEDGPQIFNDALYAAFQAGF